MTMTVTATNTVQNTGRSLMQSIWKQRVTLLVAAATLSMTGCRDLGTEPEIGLPASIELTQSAIQLGSLGERATIQATVLDQFGQPMPRAAILFTVDDSTVVAVGSDGEVMARGNGQTTVNLRVEISHGRPTPTGYRRGLAEASLPVTVRQQVGSVSIGTGFGDGAPPLVFWALGQRRTFTVEVRDPLGSPLEREVQVSFESESPDVVAVSPDGEIRAVNDGTARIRVTAEGISLSQMVEVRSAFQFSACVSSSASRAAQSLANGTSGLDVAENICAEVELRTVRGEGE